MSNVVEYELLEQIGSGSFGSVYKAKVLSGKYDGQMVAVKRISISKSEGKDGIPGTVIREIALLWLLSPGKNIIRLLHVQDFVDKRGRRNYDLIFELMDKNLREYVQEMKGTLRAKDIKVFMYQLCDGVSYLHSRTVMHRDLKPDNVLLDSSLRLKIADFGCGRQFSVPTDEFSVDALYSGYKAPEGLLFLNNYTASTDMWSVGCIFAYLASGTEHFKPQSPRAEPLDLIFSSMGTPTDDDWPGITKHINGRARNYPRKSLPKSWFKDLDNDGYDLLKKMLVYDPSKRISALEALKHSYFHGINGIKDTIKDTMV